MIKKCAILFANFIFDYFRFIRYSSVFSTNNRKKVGGKINFYYHSIEKGLINSPLRLEFGKKKIERLIYLLKKWDENKYDKLDSQFISACTVLCKYYELHKKNDVDISNFFSKEVYQWLKRYSKINSGGVKQYTPEKYFNYSNDSFKNFSNSRHSLRHFNGEVIPDDVINSVIEIARNAPSVCNRQSVEVKLLNNQELVRDALQIQAGLNATAGSVKQALIVTANLNAFVSTSERYQMYIDGGIFLQNLLYSLHYYCIGACPLNWSKHFIDDLKMETLLGLNKSEKIIALIAIGYPINSFKVPVSKRKDVSEIIEEIR